MGTAPSAQSAKTLADFAPDLPRPAIACTLARVTGSAPQAPGARMWVTAERFLGTLGGGELERHVLEDARLLLRQPKAAAHLKEYVLCAQIGQCCGGRVEVLFEPVARRKAAHLFGGGHVGRAVASVLSGMACEIRLVDARPDWARAEGLPPDASAHCEDPVEYARARAFGPEDAACVFTHSHELDYRLVRHLLDTPVGFLGLIGSEHKARVFSARLEKEPGGERLAELWQEKVRCPIGLPLEGKNPKVVAVSIAAQLLQEWGL